MKKFATFFGGAMNDTETKEYKESVLIGEFLAEKGYTIKNGGYRGLMEAVSKGSHAKNGEQIGYTCREFGHFKGNKYLTETIICETLFIRLHDLIKDSELFIIQKGGIGTLSELFLTLDIVRKLPEEERPKIILIGVFWIDIFNSMYKILSDSDMNLFTIIADCDDLKTLLS